MMNDPNTEVIKAYKSFWSTWGSRDDETLVKSMQKIHEDFNGFGTNIKEVWKSKNDLFHQLEEEVHQVSSPYNIIFDWTESSQLSKNTYLVFGELSITVNIGVKVVVLERVRSSQVWLLKDSKFHIKHWHCSLPDIGTKGEVVPGSQEPKRYEEVSVLFCDFVNFTEIVSNIQPIELVEELGDIYQHFDRIMSNESIEKIQVYGDGYLAVCGIPEFHSKHAINCINASRQIFEYLEQRNKTSTIQWQARIGIHSGPLVAGIIGERKFSFNIFGDTVNLAARLESASLPGKINVSKTTYDLIKSVYNCEYRGKIEAKGKGEIDMYFVEL